MSLSHPLIHIHIHSHTLSFSPLFVIHMSYTHIHACVQELNKMKAYDLGAKAIIFSQFVNMLDVSVKARQCSGLSSFFSSPVFFSLL